SIMAYLPSQAKDMGIEPGEVVPPQDEVVHLTSSLLLMNGSARYTGGVGEWDSAQKHYLPKTIVESYHEGEGRRLEPNGNPLAAGPRAITNRGTPSFMWQEKLMPIWISVRPFNPIHRYFDLDTFRLTGHRMMVNGRECRELE